MIVLKEVSSHFDIAMQLDKQLALYFRFAIINYSKDDMEYCASYICGVNSKRIVFILLYNFKSTYVRR